MLAHADGRALTIGELLDVLRARGPAMVMLLLAIPCVIPLLAAGMAVPSGVAVTVFGIQLTLQLKPWLPGFIARRTVSFNVLHRLVGFAVAWGGPVERLLRPRLHFMLNPVTDVVIGITLALLGIILALPLFLPGSNEIPAAAIVLLLLGLLERDGVFIIAGEVLSLAIFAACGYVGYVLWRYGFHHGWHVLRHGLHFHSTTRAATQAS